MNSKTGKMSSVGVQSNYKFTLRAAEALADRDYFQINCLTEIP